MNDIRWIKIPGRPKSSQAKNLTAYRGNVADAGRRVFQKPFSGELTVVILHVMKEIGGEMPDLDNLAKVILDALKGIAYKDDAQVNPFRTERFLCGKPVATSAPMLPPSDMLQKSVEIDREECTYVGIADWRW